MEDPTMSILVRFTGAPGMTAEKYDEVLPRIEASGEYPPDGLEYHVAFTSGGSFRVSEVWDSKEQFEAFGERLMPILDEVGIELAGEPEILEIHNIIKR
jgi:quinol monooxygenase YgiN